MKRILRTITELIALLVAGVSYCVLMGWMIDNPSLKVIGLSIPPMSLSTTIGLFCSSIILHGATTHQRKKGLGMFSQMLLPSSVLMILLLVSTELWSEVLHVRANIEDLFLDSNAILTGQMGHIISIGKTISLVLMAFIGINAMFPSMKKPKIPFSGFLISAIACTSIATQHVSIIDLQMPLHTSVLFFLLGIGLIIAHYSGSSTNEREFTIKLQHKLAAIIVGVAIFPMLFLGIIFYSNGLITQKQKAFRDLESSANVYVAKVQQHIREGKNDDEVWKIIQDFIRLGDSGELVIAKRGGNGDAIFLASSRQPENPKNITPLSKDAIDTPIIQALSKKNGLVTNAIDYRGIPVYASLRYLPEKDWGLAVQINKGEILAPMYPIRIALLFIVGMSFLFSILMAYIASSSITVPIQRLTKAAKTIGEGRLDTKLIDTIESNDEIALLANTFSSMTDELRELYEGLEQKVKERTQQLQDALQDVKKYEQAVQSSTDAILIRTNDRKVIFANKAWELLSGYKFQDIRNTNFDMLSEDLTHIDTLTDMLNAQKNGQPYVSEDIVYQRKNESTYDAELRVYPIKNKGKTTFFVETHNDISMRKREYKAKSEFVSLASHQLRTPLTAIRWQLGRLNMKFKKEKGRDDEKEILNTSRRYVANMAETISTMLMISRIASGKITLKPAPCDLTAITKGIEELYQMQCQNERKTLVVQHPEALALETDEKLLREILTNLVSNAIKYSPADTGKTTLKVSLENEVVTIIVADNGYGIPQHQQDKMFSMFFRAENALEKKIEGTGLGLYLVKQLVEFIGGTIEFTSVEHQGTTFMIQLPQKPVTSVKDVE